MEEIKLGTLTLRASQDDDEFSVAIIGGRRSRSVHDGRGYVISASEWLTLRDLCSLASLSATSHAAQLAEIQRVQAQRDEARAEAERLRLRVSELEAFTDAAQATIVSECVKHVELNGHLEIVEQCRDWIVHHAMDEGDPSGKLQDFVESLRIVADQFDKQRRRANWHEAGYKAGKQKVIDHAVDKVTAVLKAEVERMRSVYDASLELHSVESAHVPGESIAELEANVPAAQRRTALALMKWRTAISSALQQAKGTP